ncbi:MAG: alpha/beta hydrolase [Gammaproteobacteria bacterium]|nr:alpha/beta hydrolase [Gammaproteobacteria bacterium]
MNVETIYFFHLLRELCVTKTVRYGESDKTQVTYPIAAYADDIAYMIKQLGLDKAVAVGHSMGALLSCSWQPSIPTAWWAIVMIYPARFSLEHETKSSKLVVDGYNQAVCGIVGCRSCWLLT